MPQITQELLKRLLKYDPETGIFTWRVRRAAKLPGSIAGTLHGKGYITIGINRKVYQAHRLAVLYMEGYLPENDVDHRDRVRSNNKWKNLREASVQCNVRNTGLSIANTSGIKGVSWNTERGVWAAQIKVDGHQMGLGHYNTKLEAAVARWEGEKKYDFHKCDTASTALQYIINHEDYNA